MVFRDVSLDLAGRSLRGFCMPIPCIGSGRSGSLLGPSMMSELAGASRIFAGLTCMAWELDLGVRMCHITPMQRRVPRLV